LNTTKILGQVTGDQVSIVLSQNAVITFQEKPARYFESVRERIRNGRGRIRHAGADYLAYVLIDTLVDGYIHSIESLGSSMEGMESEVLNNSQKSTVEKIYRHKTNIGLSGNQFSR
jgi:magnesium transporter